MLTLQNTEAIRRIEEAIGYTFNDKRLLIQVLTRKTYLKIDPEAPDNEVLEFYGDTLMNYHVTNYFMSKYAHMLDDGLFFMRTVEQFTDMRSHYVCNRYLTDRVKALGLARYLRAQNRDAELRRDGEKAYADVFESLVGAIYLDSCQNDTLIRAFILRQLGIDPKRLPADIEAFDYDSLVEPAAADAPAVSLEEPDHAEPEPEMPATDAPAQEVVFEVEEFTAESLPASEPMEAVEAIVETPVEAVTELVVPETLREEPVASEPTPVAEESAVVVHPKQDELAVFCRELGLEEPSYGQAPPNAPNARPVATCTMKYKDAKGKPVKISLNDSGKTLEEATEKAAVKMLKKLEKLTADGKIASRTAPKAEPERPVEKPTSIPEVEISAAPAVVAEEIPVVEAAEAEPISAVEETSAESAEALPTVTDVPAVAAPAEVIEEVVAEFAVSAEPEAPAAEAVKTALEEDEDQLSIDVIDATELIPERFEWETPEAAKEPVVEIPAEAKFSVEDAPATEAAPVEESRPVEEAKPAKPARKKRNESSGERSSGKRKPAAKAEQPAEEGAVTETNAETATAMPEKVSKPRNRKPRKKQTDGGEIVSETFADSAVEATAETVAETAAE